MSSPDKVFYLFIYFLLLHGSGGVRVLSWDSLGILCMSSFAEVLWRIVVA